MCRCGAHRLECTTTPPPSRSLHTRAEKSLHFFARLVPPVPFRCWCAFARVCLSRVAVTSRLLPLLSPSVLCVAGACAGAVTCAPNPRACSTRAIPVSSVVLCSVCVCLALPRRQWSFTCTFVYTAAQLLHCADQLFSVRAPSPCVFFLPLFTICAAAAHVRTCLSTLHSLPPCCSPCVRGARRGTPAARQRKVDGALRPPPFSSCFSHQALLAFPYCVCVCLSHCLRVSTTAAQLRGVCEGRRRGVLFGSPLL